jgi:hypothetical protein
MRRTLAKEKKADASTIANFDALTIGGNTVLTGGSGSTSSLTYQLGPAAEFSSAQAKFGTKSLYLPYTSLTGFTIEGLSTSSFSGAWTLEFWFYHSTSGLTGTLMAATYQYFNGVFIDLNNTNSITLGVYRNNIGLNPSITISGLQVSAWNHISIGYNGTDRYFASVNGTYAQTATTTIKADWDAITSRIHFGSIYMASSLTQAAPTYNSYITGYLDEIRFSDVQRYTASFTPPTSAFVSDSNTFFLHHCESLLSQDAPTMTATSSSVDSSGNLAVVGDITSAVGNITTSTGDITTDRGNVNCYRDYTTTHPAWRIGPASILKNSGAFANNVAMGCYTVTGAWNTNNNPAHIIQKHWFLQSSENTNAMASFTIYCSDKVTNSGGTRQGIIRGDYLLLGGTATWYTISTTKTAALASFSASIWSTSLRVDCDSTCRICWRADVCISA